MDLRSLSDDELRALYAEAAANPAKEGGSYSGSILPLSRDASGNVAFDSNAGLLGSLKRAVTLPGRVLAGEAEVPSSGAVPGSVAFGEPGSAGADIADMASVASPINPAVRAGARAIPGMLRALKPVQPDVPSASALKQAADSGYEAVRNMGVDYSPQVFKAAMDDLEQNLFKAGAIEETAPNTFKIIRKLQSVPQAGQDEQSILSIQGLDAARQALGEYAIKGGKEGLAATRAVKAIDQFIQSPPEASVLAGPAAAASAAIGDARGNFAAAKRSNRLTGELDRAFTGAEERADLNAAVANSGQNTGNAIRQRVRDILVNPKKLSGYNDEEIAQLERVARGSPAANTSRFVGNLLGGGGGMGAMLTGAMGAGTVAAATHNPFAAAAGAMAPVVGMGAKKFSNYLTRSTLERADKSVRKRSPLYEQLMRDAPMYIKSPEKRAALVRMLMLSAQQPNQ